MKKINTVQPKKLTPAQRKKKQREYAREYHRRKMAERLAVKEQSTVDYGQLPIENHDLVDSWYEAVRTLKLSTKDIEIKKELNKILAYIISENS